MITGVSILLKQGDRYLFEIQKRSKWLQQPDGRLTIGMRCVGGRVEEGETPLQALEREVQEEVGCGVTLVEPANPFLFGPDGCVKKIPSPVLAGCLQKPGSRFFPSKPVC